MKKKPRNYSFLVHLISLSICLMILLKFSNTLLYAEEKNIQINGQSVLRIGTEGTYPPYSFHDVHGKLTGFDVEIATAVAQHINATPQFTESKWDGLIAGLDTRRYDIVVNMVDITSEREKKYNFSLPYISSKVVLIVRKEEKAIKKFEDLKGKKAAQTITSNFSKIARDAGAVLVTSDGFGQSVQLLLTSRADATINDSLSFFDFIKRKPEAAVKVVDEQSNADHCGIIMLKEKEDLRIRINEALSKMHEDGTYQTICKKYFGTHATPCGTFPF